MTETEDAQRKLDTFVQRVLALSEEAGIRHVLVACSVAPDGSYDQPVSGTIVGSPYTLFQLHTILGKKIVDASADAHRKRLEGVGLGSAVEG